MVNFQVQLRTRASLHPSGEASDYVSEYDGLITCVDEDGQTSKVGRVHAMKVHASLAADHGESLYEICDSHSQELHVLHSLLYQPKGYSFREPLVEMFDAVEWDLLILDYVVLAPKWRGLKIGLLAVRRVVDLLGGGCGLAVAGIGPINPEAHALLRIPPGWIPKNGRRQETRAAAVSLRRYYRSMGFVRLGRTPYYALPLMKRTPTAEDILTPDAG